MGYYLDFSSISLDQYKEKLKKKTMIPSRMILKEKLDERFAYFKNLGIMNVLELEKILKKKEKIMELAKEKSLSEDFLIALGRELKAIQTKPRKFKDFLGISEETISKLEKNGLKNTKHLYDKVISKNDRKEAAKTLGIGEQEILELTKLTDLTRIQWVNGTFASVLYQAGYDTIDKVVKADYEELYNNVKKLNAEQKLYKGNIGLNDMKILVEAATEVPQDIEY